MSRARDLAKYAIIDLVGTLFRAFPLPCETGLIRMGNPDRNSPVLLTCNYYLTVERVKRELRGIDCYLLVADSRGVNVWCAAAGGHLTTHSVVSALKTSGIEDLVDHRNIILPQLAAAGVEAKAIREKTGWNVIWGPVYAKYIKDFIENGLRKTPRMREVEFPLTDRIEIAVMWAFPLSILVGLILMAVWPAMVLPITGLVWGLSLAMFAFFPLYSRWLGRKRTLGFSRYTVIFDVSFVPLLMWGLFMLLLIAYGAVAGALTTGAILEWGLISFILILLFNIDLMGSTPVYKSGLHEERLLEVVLDEGGCTGCGFCIRVCPRNCYGLDSDRHIAVRLNPGKCVQCGACIVQCPFDALYFMSPDGRVIRPETIRRYKLNLLGKRLVDVER